MISEIIESVGRIFKMGRFCCRSPSKIIGLTVYGEETCFSSSFYEFDILLTCPELARRKAVMCALEARARDANKFLDTVEVPIFCDDTGCFITANPPSILK